MPRVIQASSPPSWYLEAQANKARIREAATVALEMPSSAPSIGIMDVGDGALKAMLKYAVETAYSPQPFLAVAGGIAAVGAAAGRRYATVKGLRTNVFVIAIGESGSGKDQARKCIRRAFRKAGLLENYVGGRKIASDQAIFTALEHHPVKLFLLNEFGHLLSALKGKNAAAYQTSILSTLTELFTSAAESFSGTEYAKVNRDDAGKVIPVPTFEQPHVCVYGDTVADVLWGATEGGALGDGSLARYLCFKVTDNNPMPNVDHADIDEALPGDLAEYFAAMARGPVALMDDGNLAGGPMHFCRGEAVYKIPETPEAHALRQALAMRQWEWKAKLLKAKKPTSFASRYGEHVATLAAIRSIAHNPEDPMTTDEDMAWGEALARHCIGTIMNETDANVSDSPNEANEKRLIRQVREALAEKGANELSLTDLGSATRFLDRKSRTNLIIDLVDREVLAFRNAPAIPPAKKGTQLYRLGPKAPL